MSDFTVFGLSVDGNLLLGLLVGMALGYVWGRVTTVAHQALSAAEAARVEAESSRASAEAARRLAEVERVVAERNRQRQADQAREAT